MLVASAAVLVLALGALFALAARSPDVLLIQRSISIAAPAERVFALIADFHCWNAWAPQDQQDPSLQRSYGGADAGLGAVCEWHGTGSAGKGRMQITAALAPRSITVTADFEKPFVSHNINEFTLEPAGAATKVTWTWRGQQPLPMKMMGVFLDMDRQLGAHLERGLKALKAAAGDEAKGAAGGRSQRCALRQMKE
jgi:carbon monoxide dehydrogenase subunit G